MSHPPRLLVLESATSTNDELAAARAADPAAWPDLSGLLARHQVAGHGRLGRTWTTPAGEALTVSFVIEPRRPRQKWPSLSLLGGLAAVRACARVAPAVPLAVKWPNDVVVRLRADDGPAGWAGLRKVGGVLARAEQDAVVLGIGINVHQRDLPVPWATSLALAGGLAETARAEAARETAAGEADDDVVLSLARALQAELAAAVARWRAGGFAAVREEVLAHLDTLGRPVRVEVSGGEPVVGVAQDLGPGGQLLVRDEAGTVHEVAAGDVTHLRTT